MIDSTAMSILNGHELNKNNFYRDENGPGIFLDKDGFKVYIKKLENKFHADNKYLSYIDYRVSFRRALDLQVNQLTRAIEENEPSLYKPILIR